MNTHYNFDVPQLEKYKGRSSRHECPRCHDKHSFAYYIRPDGSIIDKSVGRCNHEGSCGYHYTPKEYFKDNPWHRKRIDNYRPSAYKPQLTPTTDYVPKEFLIKSLSYNSNFVEFLSSLFDSETITRLMQLYYFGATKDKEVIFWQVDGQGRIRTGEIMQYDKDGHRAGIDWIHARMKRKGMFRQFTLTQCLFGEHLLNKYPNKDVVVVEGCKTAVIGAGVMPDKVWVSVGNLREFKPSKLRPLAGRKVIAFPDTDPEGKFYRLWCEVTKQCTFADIHVSDYLERTATAEERANKIDIGDRFVVELLQKREHPAITPLDRMIAHNPAIGLLVDKLELEEAV
ncbi:MAG: DUF6371 domain-containing protein [Prevotella sp.]|jgi:hypothetical protein